mgnify:CR=1 FL=1
MWAYLALCDCPSWTCLGNVVAAVFVVVAADFVADFVVVAADFVAVVVVVAADSIAENEKIKIKKHSPNVFPRIFI